MDVSSPPKSVYDLSFKFILDFRKLNKVKREEKLGVTKKKPHN